MRLFQAYNDRSNLTLYKIKKIFLDSNVYDLRPYAQKI